MQDIELIKAIKIDNKKAFETLFQKYYSELVDYLTVFTRNRVAAEDIVQQVFMNLWVKRKDLDVTRSVKGYLFIIAKRSYIDDYRGKKRRNSFIEELKEKALRDAIVEDEEILNCKLDKLRETINALPPKSQKILKLNKLHGLKYKEIALKLNVSVKTVESQMRIAYQKIREGFESNTKVFF